MPEITALVYAHLCLQQQPGPLCPFSDRSEMGNLLSEKISNNNSPKNYLPIIQKTNN